MELPAASTRALRLVGALLLVAGAPLAARQEADRPQNLQFFPPDIARDSLIEVMRGFSFALGVRCQYCHVGGDGVSFEGVDFASDQDEDKRKARFMLRLVETLNHGLLPLMADRDDPPYEIGCKTCHRGRPKPTLLTDVLRRTLDTAGPDSASAQYRALREQVGLSGLFDFGEWEMNVLGERLAKEGRHADAIAIYETNLESFPNSISIVLALGQLEEQIGDTAAAIRYYERALEIVPDQPRARARLVALRGGADTPRPESPRDNGYTNLRVLPADISREGLGDVMLSNLSGLGLPRRGGEGCLFCHVGSMDVPRGEWDYASDAKPAKATARVMMAMVRDINADYLAALPRRRAPELQVGCRTCHAGRTSPLPLDALLVDAFETGGVDAVRSTYAAARARYFSADAYDFRVGTLIDVADRIAATGDLEAAASVHLLNIEHDDGVEAWGGLVRLRLYQALASSGPDAMIERYRELRRTLPARAFGPLTLDPLGWRLQRSGRPEPAMRLFELNRAEHPDAFAPNESLAYAVFGAGDPERGLEIARRWVEAHPDHEGGRQLVTELLRQRGR